MNEDAKHLDIADLFAKDPLSYTEEDITAVIQKYRDSRKQFTLGNMSAGKTKALTPGQQKTNALLDKLDLKLDL